MLSYRALQYLSTWQFQSLLSGTVSEPKWLLVKKGWLAIR